MVALIFDVCNVQLMRIVGENEVIRMLLETPQDLGRKNSLQPCEYLKNFFEVRNDDELHHSLTGPHPVERDPSNGRQQPTKSSTHSANSVNDVSDLRQPCSGLALPRTNGLHW